MIALTFTLGKHPTPTFILYNLDEVSCIILNFPYSVISGDKHDPNPTIRVDILCLGMDVWPNSGQCELNSITFLGEIFKKKSFVLFCFNGYFYSTYKVWEPRATTHEESLPEN